MKKTIIIVLLALFTTVSTFSDTIYLKNGNEFKVKLLEVTKDTVKVEMNLDKSVKEYKKSELNKISLDKIRLYDSIDNINELEDKDIKFAFNAMLNQEQFPDSNYVQIVRREDIDLSGEYPVITEKHVYKVLNKDGIGGASSHMEAYLKKYQNFDLEYAVSVSPTGKVQSIYENLIEDETLFSDLPGYINLHQVKFSVPNVEPGYIVAYQVRREYKVGNDIYPLFKDITFESMVPALNQFISVKGNDSWEYRILNKGKIKKSEEDGVTTFFYTFPKEYTDTGLLPDFGYFAPRIIIYEDSSPEAFSAMLKEKMAERSQDDFEAFVGKIDFENNEPLDMIKRVFRYIQKNFTHVPVSVAAYSYIPRTTQELISKGELSSYEKTLLATEILNYLKIPVKAVLVSSRHGKVSEKDPFSFLRFHTPILMTEDEDTPLIYFGGLLHPFGIVPSSLSEQLYFDLYNNEFGELPEIDHTSHEYSSTITLKGDVNNEGALSGTLRYCPSMEADINFRAIRFKKEDEIRIMFQNMVNSFVPGAMMQDMRIENADSNDKKVSVEIDFKANGFANMAGENILFNIPLIRFSGYDVGKDTRELPVYLGEMDYTKYNIELSIPDDFRITYSPKDIKFSNKYMSIISRTRITGSDLSIVLQQETKRPLAKRKFYFKYKKAMPKLVKFSQSVIIGEKK